MKKYLVSSLIFFTFIELAFSEPLKQFQTFSWKKVAKAKKYEITIEKESSGSFSPELSQQLTDNRVELLLYPGNYRVAISVFNVLGKKTSTTPWTNFIILDETEPYLYADSFKTSKRWNSPIINLKQGGVQMIEEEDDEGTVTAREGDPTNSFFLHGKNIFFEETTFCMVPKATSTNGKPFEAYVDLRKEIPLNIIRRDTENNGVVVEYNPEELFSGYYDIVVQNPGGEKTGLELLVLSYQAPEIVKSIYQVDQHYKVNVLEVTQGQPFQLQVLGTGFDSNTIYSFEPDSSMPPYPFSSGFELESPSFFLSSHKCLDSTGTIELNLNIDTSNLHTGYYRFRANNGTSGADSTVFLVKVSAPPSYAPSIEKIKTKTGSSNVIVYNVTGQNIDADSKITLIAPYSDADDSNERIQLNYMETKRKGTLHIMQTSGETIEAGRYALLVENNISSAIFYFDVTEKLAFNLCNLSTVETESLFLRPKTKQITASAENKYIDSDYTLFTYGKTNLYGPQTLFSAAHASLSILKAPTSWLSDNILLYNGFDFQIDLLHFPYFRFDVGMKLNKNYFGSAKDIRFGADMFFEIPFQNIQPFIGAGCYYAQEISIPVQVGVRFFSYLEFSYQLCFENVSKSSTYAMDKYCIGIQIPLRSYTYRPINKKTSARISENDLIDGTEYAFKRNTTYASLDSQRVAGFAGNTTLKDIKLSNNILTIERKAFADMTNLSSISLGNSIQVIGEQAFANDTKIETIHIPSSVTTIKPGAFEGWTSDQTIYLDWTTDDETPRDLSGLYNTNAEVIYIY